MKYQFNLKTQEHQIPGFLIINLKKINEESTPFQSVTILHFITDGFT